MAVKSSSLAWSFLAVVFMIAGAAAVQSACGHHYRYRKPRADTYEWQGYFVALTILLGSGCGLAWCILIVTYNMGQRGGQELPQIPSAGEEMPAAMGHQDKLTLSPGMNRERSVSFATLPGLKSQVTKEEDQPWLKRQVSNEEVRTKSQLDTSIGSRTPSQLNLNQGVRAPSQMNASEAVSSPSQMNTNEGVRTLFQMNEANRVPAQMNMNEGMRAQSQVDEMIGNPSQMNTNGAIWTSSQRNMNEVNRAPSQMNTNEAIWTASQMNTNKVIWTSSQMKANEAVWTPSQRNMNELKRTPSQVNMKEAIWTPSQNEVTRTPTQNNINKLKRAPTQLNINETVGTPSLPPQQEGQSSRPEEQGGGTLWNFMEQELERLLSALRLHRTPTPTPAAEETPAPLANDTPSAPAEEAPKPRAEEVLGLDQTEDKETLMHLIICEVPQDRGATRGRGRKRKASRGRK
uniref:uncharacterized protein LOC114586058 n=1 Tax=Podarcis muralis TaxID=64176 RepID=UPI0010A01DEE|nr:uncharacterized protein LOC114586058 [Podarcis muralis]